MCCTPRRGKRRKLVRLFRQAIENNPSSAAAHANLGLLLASQGDESKAEQELKQAAQMAPDDPKVLPVLASLQSKLGRVSIQTCTLNNLAELQPLSAQAHVDLGNALTALYFNQAALEEFSKAARLDPSSASARL